jgi:hypothetical protein
MFRNLATTVVAAVAVVVFFGNVLAIRSGHRAERTSQAHRIVVPEARSNRVITDGAFLPEEWDGAFQHRISETCEVYLLADSVYLYVAFRFLSDVEADFVSEVYLASNNREFLNLHSSGALGEGVNSFSPDLQRPAFSVGRNTGWQSNVTGIGVRSQGKEFRISRELFPSDTVRMAGGMIVVNSTMRETANFPARYSFGSTDGWVELVLPESENQ